MRDCSKSEDEIKDDPKDEKIFDLSQEILELRKQITYLQEELSSVEDDMSTKVEYLRNLNEELELKLGEILARR